MIVSNHSILNKFSLIILLLIPSSLVTGPFLPDLFVVVIDIIFLFKVFKNKNYKLLFSNFFVYFLIIFFILLISSFFSQDMFFSFKTSFSYLRFPIFALAVVDLFTENLDLKKFLEKFIIIYLFTILILLIDGLYQYFYQENLLGWKIIIDSRVSSLFKDELVLGSYVSRFFPIAFGCSIYLFKENRKFIFLIISLLIFVISYILVFLSGERNSFVLINISIIMMLFFLTGFKKKYVLFSLFIGLIFIVFSFSSPMKDRIINQTINQLISNTESDKVYTQNDKIFLKKYRFFTEQHSHHYLSAFKIFKENMILGIGPKMFRNLCNHHKYKVSEISCSTHPHNSYLQILTETGILGFVMYFLIFIYLLACLIKNSIYKIFYKKDLLNYFQIGLVVSVVITLLPFVPSGNFFNNWLNVIYFFPVGFLLINFKDIQNSHFFNKNFVSKK